MNANELILIMLKYFIFQSKLQIANDIMKLSLVARKIRRRDCCSKKLRCPKLRSKDKASCYTSIQYEWKCRRLWLRQLTVISDFVIHHSLNPPYIRLLLLHPWSWSC